MTTGAILFFLGLGGGLIGAVFGIGGGVFLIPILVLFCGFSMVHAVATGLVTVIATSSAVASVNLERGLANIRLGMVLELATVLGALLSAFAAGKLPQNLLVGLFGALLGAVSILMWRGQQGELDIETAREKPGLLDGEYFDPAAGRKVGYQVRRLGTGLAVSFGAGAVSGLLGVGGGVFKVPAMHLFCGLPMKAAAATSNYMIGVTAAASAFLYFNRGAVLPGPTALIVLGVLGGSVGGTWLNLRLKDAGVRRGFAVMLGLLSVRMLVKAWHG